MVVLTMCVGGYGRLEVVTVPWATAFPVHEQAIYIWVLCEGVDMMFPVPPGATTIYASPLGVVFA